MRRSLLILGFLIIVIVSSLVEVKPAASEPLDVVAEGRDFATQVLRDPWDMKEYTDVSQYLNASNNYVSLDNISIADGLFSAREINKVDAGFFALFPGYDNALQVGKVGNNYPIPTSSFSCLYYAMKVDRQTNNHITGVWWYSNDNWAAPIGKTTWKNVPDTNWHLYKWDLRPSPPGLNESEGGTGLTKWNERSSWIGLKVIPEYDPMSINPSPSFNIDWIRLTDCNPVYKNITWAGSNTVNIYLTPSGTSREIKVTDDITGTSLNLDIQGIEPGVYTYLVKKKSDASILATGTFTINAAPILTFDKPSMTSGADFATTVGNLWDMADPVDAEDTYGCVSETWADGLMKFDTVDRLNQVTGCYSGTKPNNNNDPIFYLNTPGTIDPSVYRYLSYRIYSDGRPINGSDPAMYFQDIVNGMVIRYGVALGLNGNNCKEVSNDVPFDVGWNTYSIDLYNGTDGLFEQWTGSCPSSKYWNQTGPIEIMRIDPNENQLGRTLHQELDWIKLTKMDQVKSGTPFTFQLKANKPAGSLPVLNFYYTTNPSNPTQYPAVEYITTEIPSPVYAFLPMTLGTLHYDFNPEDISFVWDTSGVSPAEYYICVSAGEGYDTVSYCSNAPVEVY